ncbi:hypothetical protein ACJJTC_018141 [Scirpophaga incertulas]
MAPNKTKKKDNWQCPACKSKQRKVDNTNTPVQGCRMSAKQNSPEKASDENNITIRKPATSNPSLQSPTSPCLSLPNDEVLLATIRSEIQRSVAESLESMVQMYFMKEFNEIKKELTAVRELQNCVEYLSAEYDRMKSELQTSQEKISSLGKVNSSLSDKLNDLTNRLNLIEQHSRETNIEISGIPENKSENLVSVFQQLCNTVSISVLDTDVLASTRIRKLKEDTERPRSVIIKLQNTEKRDEILAAVSRYNRKNQNDKLNTSNLGYGGQKLPIYVSEHLSPYNKALHASTRKVAREKAYKFVWIRNGRIFVRKDDQASAKLIKCYDSLSNL